MLLTILKGFKKIRETSSRNRKMEIMKYLLEKKRWTSEILKYTYDPFWTYNVTADVEYDDPKVRVYQHCHEDDDKWKVMRRILNKLRDRDVTGNKAKSLVNDYLANVNSEISEVYAHWFSMILHKNLKIGLSAGIIDKLVPGLVPTFKIQKATVYEEGNELPERFFIEPKYDGLRGLVAIPEEGIATAYSSKGKPLWNLDGVLEELDSTNVRGVVLDGEFYGKNWNKTISDLQTESKRKSDVKYYVFDMLTMEEWAQKKCELDLKARHKRIHETFGTFRGMKRICRVPRTVGYNKKALAAEYSYLLGEGFEGAMVKSTKGLYQFRRSKAWQKYKPVFTCDLKIVGVQEGEGEIKGMLGALLCMGRAEWNGKTWAIKTKVGTGYDRKTRKKLWRLARQGKLLNQMCEVEFQEVAMNKTKVKIHRLRFPSYVRLRPDK